MNRIERAKALVEDIEPAGATEAYLQMALPVIEAALAANPATSIGVALGDTLIPWKEK